VTLFADAARLALDDGDVGATAGHLQEVRNMAREAMLDMRVLIFELHPPALKEEGLAGANQARLATVEARAGLNTEFRTRGEGTLPLPLEQELWGFTQEALNNVVKHARARRVTVELRFREGGVSLEVHDDGVGFDPAGVAEGGGLGLRSLAGRMRRVGGAFHLQSAPGAGTTVRAEVECERGARPGENGRG
jgi:signal transduction histidine kinase